MPKPHYKPQGGGKHLAREGGRMPLPAPPPPPPPPLNAALQTRAAGLIIISFCPIGAISAHLRCLVLNVARTEIFLLLATAKAKMVKCRESNMWLKVHVHL